MKTKFKNLKHGHLKMFAGNNIRYIILPDALPLDTLLIDDEPRKKAAKARASRGGRGGRYDF